MNCNLVGFKRNMKFTRNWGGLLSHRGVSLNDKQARKVVDYGIEHGYKTAFDIPDEEVDEVLGWKK